MNPTPLCLFTSTGRSLSIEVEREKPMLRIILFYICFILENLVNFKLEKLSSCKKCSANAELKDSWMCLRS